MILFDLLRVMVATPTLCPARVISKDKKGVLLDVLIGKERHKILYSNVLFKTIKIENIYEGKPIMVINKKAPKIDINLFSDEKKYIKKIEKAFWGKLLIDIDI